MIAIIRISGKVKIRQELEETLSRLRLRRKYVCVLLDEKEKVKSFKWGVVGFVAALVLVAFAGWLDVTYSGSCGIEYRESNPVKYFVVMSAWELLFLIIGIIIGVVTKKYLDKKNG